MSTRVAVTLTVLLAFSTAAVAQDVLHLKFDAGAGAKVINYASHSGIAPAEGDIVATPVASAWGAGKFGPGLIGGTTRTMHLDTGWPISFTGSFTMAMFIKMRRPPPSNSAAYLVRGPGRSGGFQATLSGVTKLLAVRWGNGNGVTRTDVLSPSAFNWVHVALVVDAAQRTFVFYIDGKPEVPQALSQPPRVQIEPGGLLIGTPLLVSNGSYDIDEFRFRLGTATAAEIQRWATENPAADGAYGKGCWPKGRTVLLDSNADKQGAPSIGNAAYALELYALPGASYLAALGTNRLRFGSQALPLDLGFLDPALAGCFWETSADLLLVPGVIGATGKAVLPFPVPRSPSLIGVTVYSQVALFSAVLNRWMTSNAFATAFGK